MSSTMAPRRLRLLFAVVAAALLLSSLAQRYLGHVLANPNLDFYDYYLAGEQVHESPRAPLYATLPPGENPQLRSAPAGSQMDLHARRAGLSDVELYLYPPLLADVLAPVTRIPMLRAAMLWRIVNLLLVLGSAALLARVLRVPLASFEFLGMAMLAYSFWPVHEAVSLGQVSVLLLALWAVAVWGYATGRPGLSGAALAVGTAIKVTPLLVLALPLVWRDRRWLAWYAGTLLALVAAMTAVNGPANLLASVHMMGSMGGGVPAIGNKGIPALLGWLRFGRVFSTAEVQAVLDRREPLLGAVSKAASLGFYAVCVWLVWRRRGQDAHLEQAGTAATTANTYLRTHVRTTYLRITDDLGRATEMAVFALVTALCSPVSWRHGYTVALLPLALLWAGALRSGATRLRAWLLAATTVAMGSLAFDLAAVARLPEPVRIALASVWVVAGVGLCLEVLLHGPKMAAVEI